MSFLQKIFTENLMKNLSIILIGLYLIALSGFAIFALIKILNLDITSGEAVLNLYLFHITINAEMKLIFIAATMGILGSLIYSITSFTAYVGSKIFNAHWTLWYLLRPFNGILLSIIVYMALRGGLLNWNSSSTDAVNQYGIAAICGLVGLFSKQTIAKLKEIFENIFTTQEENLGGNLQGQNQNQAGANNGNPTPSKK